MSIGSKQASGEVQVSKLLGNLRAKRPIRGMGSYSNHPDELRARRAVLLEVKALYLQGAGAFMALITPETVCDGFAATKARWEALGILAHAQCGLVALYGFGESDKALWGKASRFLRMVQERASGWYFPEIGWHPFKAMDFSSAFEGRKAAKLGGVLQKLSRLQAHKDKLERQLDALCWSDATVRAHFDRARTTYLAAKTEVGVLDLKAALENKDLKSLAQLALGALTPEGGATALSRELRSQRRDLVLDKAAFAGTPYEAGVRALRTLVGLRKLSKAQKSGKSTLLERQIRVLDDQIAALNKTSFYSGGTQGQEWLDKSVALRETAANAVFSDVHHLAKLGTAAAKKAQLTPDTGRIYTLEGAVQRARREAAYLDSVPTGPDAFERSLLELAALDFEDGSLSFDELCACETHYSGRALKNLPYLGSLEERETLEAEVSHWNGEASRYLRLSTRAETQVLSHAGSATDAAHGPTKEDHDVLLTRGLEAIPTSGARGLIAELSANLPKVKTYVGESGPYPATSRLARSGSTLTKPVVSKKRVSSAELRAHLASLLLEARTLASDSTLHAGFAVAALQSHWRTQAKE